MPYIKQKDRVRIDEGGTIGSSGELNYAFTKLVNDYVNNRDLNYQTINDVVGALEGAKLEFYRRVAVPFENYKMSLNHDVYQSGKILDDN